MPAPRTLVVAGLTVITAIGLTNSILPDTRPSAPPPAAQMSQADRAYTENQRRLREEHLRKQTALQRALEADALRARQARPAERAAERITRSLIRRP